MANVLFKVGLRAEYDALATKNTNALYWLTDTQQLYKGDLLFAVGAEATTASAGLLSAADKAKLDAFVGGAMRFRGVFEALDEVTLPINGDIVIIGSKEYIYSEENGWAEFGDESLYLTKAEAAAIYATKDELMDLDVSAPEAYWAKKSSNVTTFEIVSAVDGFLTVDGQNDLRVYIPTGAEYTLQNVGAGGSANTYYMHARAWAPRADITGCRKGTYEQIDQQVEMEKIKIDAKSGRPYVDFWLGIAYTEDNGATWTSYADLSTETKYMGFNWIVNWYSDEELVASGSRKITLVNNKEALYNHKDWYIPALEAKIKEVTETTEETKTAMSWGSIN